MKQCLGRWGLQVCGLYVQRGLLVKLAAQLSSGLQNSLQGLLWQFLVSFQSQTGGGHTEPLGDDH